MSFTDFKELGDHDSRGYKMLYEPAVETLKNSPVDYHVVEVGVREGGSLLTLMNAVVDTDPNRVILSIDPYGSKPYLTRDQVIDGMYPDVHYIRMLDYVTPYVVNNKLNWSHYKHTSLDWIAFWPNTDFWINGKIVEPKFSFVHLDGDHTNSVVAEELRFFTTHTFGWVVVDDADQLELHHDDIKKYIDEFNGYVKDNYLWLRCE